MEYVTVSATEFARLDGLDDWRVVLGRIVAEFEMGSFPDGAALVTEIAQAAELAGHHPDVQLTYPGRVRVQLTTHAMGGLTERDTDLARTISRSAAELGATPHPTDGWDLEIIIETGDAPSIRRFWRAVLDYEDDGELLVDPQRRGPTLRFSSTDRAAGEGNRLHLDVTVPHDVAEGRIAAALAAGATLASDGAAPAFWILADADGNEARVSTWQDR